MRTAAGAAPRAWRSTSRSKRSHVVKYQITRAPCACAWLWLADKLTSRRLPPPALAYDPPDPRSRVPNLGALQLHACVRDSSHSKAETEMRPG